MDMIDSTLSEMSAYHGGSWRPRANSRENDCNNPAIWREYLGTDSEFESLSEVVMLQISENFPDTSEAEKIQFLAPLIPDTLRKEYEIIERTFKENRIKVHKILLTDFPHPSPNLLFCRDLFFSTPFGAILARMGSNIRAGEEKFAQLALARLGVPILRTISGKGTFEGADALWLNENTVLIGIGNRTNEEGYDQIRLSLNEFGITCIKIPLPRKTQHLLGILQIVDRDLALVRTEIAPPELIESLAGFPVVPVGETEEVVFRQALNFVTIGPRKILMAADCPEMKALLEGKGVSVCAELPVSQLISGAGGLACATGILTRKLRFREN